MRLLALMKSVSQVSFVGIPETKSLPLAVCPRRLQRMAFPSKDDPESAQQ